MLRYLLFLLLILIGCHESAKIQPPNVLFIAIDDLNDWVGCLGGHPQAQTPNIDALAKSGTLFSNAHTQSPLCNPSRTSILTGLRPSTTGIYGLAPWFRNLTEFQDLVSLPQHFAQNGYRTYSTGKIYHGGYGRKENDREFDELGPGASVGAKPEQKIIPPTPGGDHPLMDWGTFPHRDEDKGDWAVASWAVEKLSDRPKEPFFLSAGFFLPHVPCYATEDWFDLYPGQNLELPPMLPEDRTDTPRFSWYLHWDLPEPRLKWLEDNQQLRPLIRAYLASISFVDSQVGRIVEALKTAGYADNTIIVLWSDHGYHLGSKAISGKNTLWEPSTRVPLLFAGPGITPGARCVQPAELLDLYPTLSELCGLEPPSHLEGHSLVPQLKDANATRPWPAITTHNHDNHSVRTTNWRYIRYADGSEELYDMQNDPEEWTNLAITGTHQGKIEELSRWLPGKSLRPAPGSKHRILTYQDGMANWQGTNISQTDTIPGL